MSDEGHAHVGLRAVEVTDSIQAARVPVHLLYPTDTPGHEHRFGPYALTAAVDAPPSGEGRALVVVSHGTGSTPWALRGLALHLARAGSVVALVEHPGNSRSDDRLAHTAANLANRPRHLRLAIDAALADARVGSHLVRDAVAVLGHSLGAYTALALAGGRPFNFPPESPDGQSHPVAVTPDPRVRALVLLAPATGWYVNEGSLAAVDVPILMRTGEHDEITRPEHAALVVRGVSDRAKVDHRVVPNAGHFSFLTPFPPPMARPDFLPAHDPPGFDRASFQRALGGEVAAFLRGALWASGGASS
ncbi:MAG: alpha/beta hydrolase [Myxococcales bacterium]|nr:MAG: alpha/beta hydrolase [Myxococcales bacterium]